MACNKGTIGPQPYADPDTNGRNYKEWFNQVARAINDLGAGSMSINPMLNRNGSFRIWQRGTTFTDVGAAGAGIYTADGWVSQESSAGSINITRDTDVPEKTRGYSLKVDVTGTDTSVATSDFCHVTTTIENSNIWELGWGTNDTQSATISFWVKSSVTGAHGMSIGNWTSGSSRNYSTEYTISDANTWEKKEITVEGDTNVPGWALSANMSISFGLLTGSLREGTKDTWSSGVAYGLSTSVNVLGTISSTWQIAQVKVEVGEDVTSFRDRQFAEEVEIAERTFQKSYDIAEDPGTSTGILRGTHTFTAGRATTNMYDKIPFRTRMRVKDATIAIYGTTGTANEITGTDSANLTYSSSSVGQTGITEIVTTGAAVAGDRYAFHWTAEIEL